MAELVCMPRQGNTVESCIIASWKKKQGEDIKTGEVLCEVETDKAVFEIEAPVTGKVLKLFFDEGADVPVLEPIAVIGQPGEDISQLTANQVETEIEKKQAPQTKKTIITKKPEPVIEDNQVRISPRARKLALEKGIDISKIKGSGPGNRIIERDIKNILKNKSILTKTALQRQKKENLIAPQTGSGIGGMVLAEDLKPQEQHAEDLMQDKTEMELSGIRKIIAQRMQESLANSAQLTLHTSADAQAILDGRQKIKRMAGKEDIPDITINDILLFITAKVLAHYKDLNSHFKEGKIIQYKDVHLSFAVSTDRGLIVPVIHKANLMDLKQIARLTKQLIAQCQKGDINPDFLSGGTFTVTNLGSLGIDNFTPILNLPQVAILGVGNINLKPLGNREDPYFSPYIGLSLTFDHRVIDGAQAATFLKALCERIKDFSYIL